MIAPKYGSVILSFFSPKRKNQGRCDTVAPRKAQIKTCHGGSFILILRYVLKCG